MTMYTLRDAMREKADAEALRDHKRDRRRARITPEVWQALLTRKTRRVTDGPYSLTLSPDRSCFVLRGPSGTHTLYTEATSAERLAAHWRGFVSHA